MEILSGEQPSEQGQQVPAQSVRTQPAPIAEQPAEIAVSHHQTSQNRGVPEVFAVEEEAPTCGPQTPQSTGVQNQSSLAITPAGQSHLILPAISASLHVSNQEEPHIQPVTAALNTNTDLREQLREEIGKEMEVLCGSRLAQRTLEVETFWRQKLEERTEEAETFCRAQLEERTKEVENYWKPKLALSNNDLHEQIEKLKTRLEKGPRLIKAAEERGRRQGELDRYNRISLNPELKPSQDRLNFDFLMKEKEKEIAEVKTARDNLLQDAQKYSKDTDAALRARDQEIQGLRAQLEHPPPQQPLALDHTNAMIMEGRELRARFDGQTQELINLQNKCSQQADDLANLAARSDHQSQALNDREQRLGAQSAEIKLLKEQLAEHQLLLNESRSEIISAPQPSLPTLPSPATAPNPSPQRSRFLSLRSLLVVVLIFLLTFFIPFLQSFSNSSLEHELGGLTLRDDRMRWEASELTNKERSEGVPTYEQSWLRTEEVMQMGDWGS